LLRTPVAAILLLGWIVSTTMAQDYPRTDATRGTEGNEIAIGEDHDGQGGTTVLETTRGDTWRSRCLEIFPRNVVVPARSLLMFLRFRD
jgi:hypothetical protein